MTDNTVKAECKVLIVVVIFILVIILLKNFLFKESFFDMFYSSGCTKNNIPTPTPPLKYPDYRNVRYPYPSYLNNSKYWNVNSPTQPYQSPPLTQCNTDNDCTASEKCGKDNICKYNTPLIEPNIEKETDTDNRLYYWEDSMAAPLIFKDPPK